MATSRHQTDGKSQAPENHILTKYANNDHVLEPNQLLNHIHHFEITTQSTAPHLFGWLKWNEDFASLRKKFYISPLKYLGPFARLEAPELATSKGLSSVRLKLTIMSSSWVEWSKLIPSISTTESRLFGNTKLSHWGRWQGDTNYGSTSKFTALNSGTIYWW